jgi:hypothetical protein
MLFVSSPTAVPNWLHGVNESGSRILKGYCKRRVKSGRRTPIPVQTILADEATTGSDILRR